MTHRRTPQTDQQLSSMWTAGETVEDICKALGMQKGALLAYRRDLGLADRRITAKHTRGWSADDLAEVSKRWKRGESASEIARMFPGRTRNAVISLMHRTNQGTAVRRPASQPKPPKPGPQSRPGAVFGKVSVLSAAETQARRAQMVASGHATIAAVETASNDNAIRLMDRGTFQCSWPIGVPDRPADQMCCGQAVPTDSPRATPSYCDTHARLGLSANQPKRKVPTEPSVKRRAA